MGIREGGIMKNREQTTLIHCKDCIWFAGLEEYPEAEAFHKRLQELFGDVFPKREGECGICRKVTFCRERPVPTNAEGFCHRAQRRE